MADDLLTIYAGKLGVYSPKIISKAAELNRLLEVKASSEALRFLNISGTAQVVICLDLAAQITNIPVEKNEAMKLSGLKKRIYQSFHKSIENMLDLRNVVNVQDLGIQFGCLQAVQLAKSILKIYAENLKAMYAFHHVDASKPVHTVVAFYAATRKLKMKVDKQKLFEISRESSMTILRILTEMNKIVSDMQVTVPQKRKRKANSVEMESNFPVRGQKLKTEDEVEDYDAWKERMLQSANDFNDN